MTDSAETERRTLVLNCCALLATSAAVSMSSRELVTSWWTELCRWADRAVFSAMSSLLLAVVSISVWRKPKIFVSPLTLARKPGNRPEQLRRQIGVDIGNEAIDRADQTLCLIFELGELPRVVRRRCAQGDLERHAEVAPDLLQRQQREDRLIETIELGATVLLRLARRNERTLQPQDLASHIGKGRL